MAARHALTSAGCSHCRLAVLKLFAGPANALPSVRASSLQCQPRLIPAASIRAFSSQLIRNGPAGGTRSTEDSVEENDALDNQEHEHAATDSSSTNIPWYLQVEPPRHVASIEPPPLPEVPSGSPKIIGSLLEYVSEDLGLDELSLLDLRELDPPAALGPNLFMLFGTARSERHLNVSAGRLLRWLRAKHLIWAHADGLLGPKQRKTKLRRKAKRSKLLGGVEDTDDGIKTGWICVNLGTIGFGKEESAVVADDGRVAGFGVSQNGSTIVVQIMTESRRAELGLEALWKQALDEPVDDSVESEPQVSDNMHPLEKAILSSRRSSTIPQNGHFNNTSRRTPFEQTRFYSTQQETTHGLQGIDPLLRVHSKEALEETLKVDYYQRYRLFELLRDRFNDLSPASAIKNAPGNSVDPQVLSAFVRLSKFVCQGLPAHHTWGFRLALQTKASEPSEAGHTETLHDVRQLIEEMNLYGIKATREQYLQLLTCIYSSGAGELREFKEQTRLAQRLLKTVHQRGQPILANDIIVTVIETVARHSDRYGYRTRLELLGRLEDLVKQAGLPCMDESSIMRLLSAYAKLDAWQGFWNVWRMPPKHLRPRSAAMYIHLYELAAATNSRALCTVTVRRCFQQMLTEDPPIPLSGAVLRALKKCIHIADPSAELIANSISPRAAATGYSRRENAEFVKLLRNIRLLDR
ncbi:hypothetical protein F5Y13DRAFT_169715 [Hypoxylon sp. FL1857]|nr:hypothetical protein F5Y13DRAFT_169715 [Hypoxylon sp. FL1857]